MNQRAKTRYQPALDEAGTRALRRREQLLTGLVLLDPQTYLPRLDDERIAGLRELLARELLTKLSAQRAAILAATDEQEPIRLALEAAEATGEALKLNHWMGDALNYKGGSFTYEEVWQEAEAEARSLRLGLDAMPFLLESVKEELGVAPDPAPATDAWQPFTLADAYQERPPSRYVAGKLFELPSLNVIYGAPGTLKSFLLADLSVCVAGGLPWLPPLKQPCEREKPCEGLEASQGSAMDAQRKPVVWVDFDNGPNRSHQRFAALGRAAGAPAELPLHYYSMPSPWLNGLDRASVGRLAQRVKAAEAALVVVDNLGNVSGGADENSVQMVQVLANFRQLAEDCGAAVVLVHHQRKANGFRGRLGETLRGHSSIEAALDLALLVERKGDQATVRATKARGEEPAPFAALFTYQAGKGAGLETARFFGIPLDEPAAAQSAALAEAVRTALAAGALNKSALAEAVKRELPEVGINRIRAEIDQLAVAGTIVASKGRDNATLYKMEAEAERESDAGLRAHAAGIWFDGFTPS